MHGFTLAPVIGEESLEATVAFGILRVGEPEAVLEQPLLQHGELYWLSSGNGCHQDDQKKSHHRDSNSFHALRSSTLAGDNCDGSIEESLGG